MSCQIKEHETMAPLDNQNCITKYTEVYYTKHIFVATLYITTPTVNLAIVLILSPAVYTRLQITRFNFGK